MRLITLIVFFTLVYLNGCSAHKMWYGSDKPMMSFVIVDGHGEVQHEAPLGEKTIQGYIITWSPEYNGAFVSSSGKGCIQPAMYATTASGEAAVPTEIFTQGLSGSLTGAYEEALDKLISVTDQSTFLSIGMYGICQLSAADGLTAADTAELVKLLFEKASSSKNEQTRDASSPQLSPNPL
ncbi:hypothetical protein [Vibrio astriarenae]|uniref:hypothetical protein n=1 Tax=Vibrio astriarenae TaxID=1481923 RepID=UPI00373666BC